MMLASIFKPFQRVLKTTNSRALEKALEAAKAIKKIENEHFKGQAIAFDPEKGKTVSDYFQTQLDQQLLKIRYHLGSFRTSSFFSGGNNYPRDKEAEIIEKLEFIEVVLKRYRDRPNSANIVNTAVITDTADSEKPIDQNIAHKNLILGIPRLPRGNNGQHSSLIGAMSQIRRELAPEYEDEVIEAIRIQRREKKIAIRWMFLLFLIPLLIQITSRNVIFEPLLDHFRDQNPARVEISEEVSERFLREFSRNKERLEIAELMGMVTPEKKREKLEEIAVEVYTQAGYRSLDALKNIAADLISMVAFVGLLFLGREQLVFIRRFIDRTFRSLNDVTKVYIFILATDLFVGFHSAEAWEVILLSITHHFGLPENQNLVFIFIATVPVILDSTFKLWIFSYLSGSSPSSVAIYEKMNQ
ncbi:hypothetical protein [Gloeocapsa sp. PCC 73106]|uniref:hypothetical protein n=1 Tax=Gloeocapsa sp. PCC 73106 TaxID=102232 RepID=UPI0002AC2E93|nr:hypothetical protein [Gloeocapsa sp. PCC 73106]ELR99423.1 CemA family [Gloeocapsa sp. PCC 73106]